MANAGTLPDYCYQRELVPSSKINLKLSEVVTPGSSCEELCGTTDEDRGIIDEIPEPEFETNSSGSSSEDENDEEDGSIDSCAYFMVGRTLRSERAVKLNSRFFK